MIKIRMCIHCRARFAQQNLLRMQIKNGELIAYSYVGRSFYLCELCVLKEPFDSICNVAKVKLPKDVILTKLKEMSGIWQKKY